MVEIRLALPSDAGALSQMNYEFNDVGMEPPALRRRLQEGGEIVAIAFVDGGAAGFACAPVHLSICYPTPCAEITELFERAAFRRRRIATGLIAFLEKQLACRRVTHIRILTGFGNEAAQALYGKFGYQHDRERPEIVFEKDMVPPTMKGKAVGDTGKGSQVY